jgi:hypothetical protein
MEILTLDTQFFILLVWIKCLNVPGTLLHNTNTVVKNSNLNLPSWSSQSSRGGKQESHPGTNNRCFLVSPYILCATLYPGSSPSVSWQLLVTSLDLHPGDSVQALCEALAWSTGLSLTLVFILEERWWWCSWGVDNAGQEPMSPCWVHLYSLLRRWIVTPNKIIPGTWECDFSWK